MTAAGTIDNLALAERAHEVAGDARNGSLRKAVAGSVAVACATTRSLPEAREVLDGMKPKDVRDAALEFLDELTTGIV